MDGRPPGDRSTEPGELLRSALEKIVFFECRVAQLESELAAARQVAERARADAAEARSREAEAATQLVAEREAGASWRLSQVELAERVHLLETERERLLGGLVERARLGGASGPEGQPGPEEGGADLAGFIAELRGELETLRAWKESHQAGRPGPAPTSREPAAAQPSLDALAGAFASGGRTGVAAADVRTLEALLPTNADRVLYRRAMADLGSKDPEARLAAVRRLAALGSRAAAPLLAASLGREPEAAVKVALLQALASFQEAFAADLVARELSDPRAEVRAAALEALSAVAEDTALPRLVEALGDRSPLVRRRAAVLLNASRDERAEEALVAALRDPDGGVARTAAVALSGRGSERVHRALARREAEARASLAAEVAGGGAAPAPSPAALRIAARLGEITAPAHAVARAAAPRPPPAPSPASSNALSPAPRPAGLARPHAAIAVLEAAATAGPAGDGLSSALELELRGALRGRTGQELCQATGAPAERVEAALEVLRGRGTAVLRGARWCIA